MLENRAFLWSGGLSLAALLLSGCGSVVYKDAATTYVVAGRAATKSIADASTSLATSQDELKATKIVSDPSCPIGEQRIFLRDPRYRGVFKDAIARIPGMSPGPACGKLIHCEESIVAAECRSACFSAEEANCIVLIETNTAITLKSLPDGQSEKFSEASKPLARALSAMEYGRAAPVQNVLVKSSLGTLLEYLDMLDKLTTKRESEAADDAKKISDGLAEASKQLTNLNGQKLSDADKKTQDQITGAVAALGKFAGDTKVIADNARDVGAIKRFVVEHSSDAQLLIERVKLVAVSDATLALVYSDLANIQTRQNIQSRYVSARDAYERSLILSDRNKAAYGNGSQLEASIGALFDAMSKSHENLVRLVMNPDDKDLQKVANARLQEFKLIASDVVTIAQLFH